MKTDRDKLARVLFDQIVVRDCYGLRSLPTPPHTVVDIGANCGMFSMLARFLYPRARVISVEPCPETFGMLVDNTRFFNCEVHNVALSRASYVTISQGKDSGSNSTCDVPEDSNQPCAKTPGMTLEEMFRRWAVYPTEYPVYLKVDCEGAERVILEHSQSEQRLMECYAAGFELHYCDGRGKSKWANALPAHEVQAWVKWLANVFDVEYEAHNQGGLQGAVLQLRTEWKPGQSMPEIG